MRARGSAVPRIRFRDVDVPRPHDAPEGLEQGTVDHFLRHEFFGIKIWLCHVSRTFRKYGGLKYWGLRLCAGGAGLRIVIVAVRYRGLSPLRGSRAR